MKKLVALVLVLMLTLGCVSALAEAKTEYNIHVLVWKFDDTYGSTVRQGMMKWKEIVEDELGVKINLTMDDAQDDMAKQVEQADLIVFPGGAMFGINYLGVADYIERVLDIADKNGTPVIFGSLGFNHMENAEEHDDRLHQILSFHCNTPFLSRYCLSFPRMRKSAVRTRPSLHPRSLAITAMLSPYQ